jgi:hypothetical protein
MNQFGVQYINTWKCFWRFQDGDKREEAESMLPKVKSWRETGEHLAGKTTKKR